MNIYDYYIKPSDLDYYDKRPFVVPSVAYDYAMISGERFLEGEPAIAKSAKHSLWYAQNILGYKRFKLGEPSIARDPTIAYYYAVDVIKGRWPEGEAAIAKDAFCSLRYARDVIRERFELAEPVIANTNYARRYNNMFGTRLSEI